jgi:hypothetical protein
VEPEVTPEPYDPEYLQDVIRVFETARSRLAVAVAADSKITPPGQRECYRETDQRLRRCLRDLRSLHRLELSEFVHWSDNVAALRSLLASFSPGKGRSRELCVRLQDVLARVEAHGGAASCGGSSGRDDKQVP